MIELIPVLYNVVRGIVTQITNAVSSINANTNAARDNINSYGPSVTNAARDNVKAHVTAAVGGIIRQNYTVFPTIIWVNGNGGAGGVLYADIPISAVNVNKASIQPAKSIISINGISVLTYRFISSTVVRVEASYGSSMSAGSGWVVGFSVMEFI